MRGSTYGALAALTCAGALIASTSASAAPVATAAQAADTPCPTPPTKIAVVNGIGFDTLVSIGAPVKGADVSPFPTYMTPYTQGIASLGKGGNPGTDWDAEALAGFKPDCIVAPSYDNAGPGTFYGTAAQVAEAVAPTIFFNQPNPYVDPSGKVQSTWKNWVHQVADPLDMGFRADQVIGIMDRRAATIRPLVAGKTVSLLSLASASTFETSNDYLPLANVYVQDLGLKNLNLAPENFAARCNTPTPTTCYSNALSTEYLPLLNGADALLFQTLNTSNSDIATFQGNPLFGQVPAIAKHAYSTAQAYTDTGPLGIALEYSGLATSLGVKELRTSWAGPKAGAASVSLAGDKVCWDVAPKSGKSLAGAIGLSLGSGKGESVVLSPKPRYLQIDPVYAVGAQTTGCKTIPATFAKKLATSPQSVRFTVGTIASPKLSAGGSTPVISTDGKASSLPSPGTTPTATSPTAAPGY